MTITIRSHLCLALAGLAYCLGAAAAEPPKPAAAAPQADQVVVPEVSRRDINLPRLPSSDFEIGTYVGTYSTQDFGSSLVTGLRFGYHISEDFFVEAVYAKTKVSDESY